MQSTSTPAAPLMYRSGAAARLAGLSVETLRVWERRYQLSDAARSHSGQRLYSAQQVARLGMLKQLVDRGHPIGVLAKLSLAQLQTMLAQANGRDVSAPSVLRLVLVGPWLVRRVLALGPASVGVALAAQADSLAELTALTAPEPADVLVLEQPELDEQHCAAILSAIQHYPVAATVVLYRYGASSTIRALRAGGALVARIPADLAELAPLCRAALLGPMVLPDAVPAPPLTLVQAPSQRLDEAALAAIVAAGNRIACECPRHLAELLLMAGSFERYSRQCAARDPQDAALHAALAEATGHARVILEQAMTTLALADGLPLPDGVSAQTILPRKVSSAS